MAFSFSKKFLTAALIGLMGIVSTISSADAWGGRRHGHGGGHGGGHHYRGGGGGIGPGVAIGVLGGLMAGAALAQPRYAPQPYYGGYQQQPVYYAHRPYRPRAARCFVRRYDAYGQPYRQRVRCAKRYRYRY